MNLCRHSWPEFKAACSTFQPAVYYDLIVLPGLIPDFPIGVGSFSEHFRGIQGFHSGGGQMEFPWLV